MSKDSTYPSKIMLVGEYGVVAGGSALTIPFNLYKAKVRGKGDIPRGKEGQAELSRQHLEKIFSYISGLPENSFHAGPDLDLFTAKKHDYWLDMNIPAGYGLGSSGAVSAAIYDLFFPGAEKLTLEQQRDDLALIESFFHGKSSGVDALTCHSKSALYFHTDGSIRRVEMDPSRISGGYRLFLLDSGEHFETAPLVEYFLNQMEISGYASSIRYEFLVINQKLIEIFLGKREGDPALLFRAISDFQFTHFRRMIPESMIEAWLEGQISNEYYLKLNGSGGGFMLGICHESFKESLENRWNEKLIWI